MDNLDLGGKVSFRTKNGWQIPEEDRECFDVVINEVNDIQKILPHCNKKRTCIQAGGNIGIWAVNLSQHFDTVHTFEPDQVNYEAMVHNLHLGENIIIPHNAALGAKKDRGSIFHFEKNNIGAHQVVVGDGFDIVTIDSFNFKDVDLIQLDIEGFEHFALLGALETIKKYSPAICVELKGLGEKHGFPDSFTIELLERLGYTQVAKFHRDLLFIKK
jgi:FkbM family methyltransferase